MSETTPKGFGAALRRAFATEIKAKVTAAVVDTAARLEAEAVRLTDEAGAVDLTTYKASWEHRRTLNGAILRNTAPYAAVIEYGRRPGAPGPPLEPILKWVKRKLVPNGVVDPKEAVNAAYHIRNSIHVKGTRPRGIMRKTISKTGLFLAQSLRRIK